MQWVGSTYMVGGYWVLGSTHMVLVEMKGRFVRSGIAEPGSTRDITARNLTPKKGKDKKWKKKNMQIIFMKLETYYVFLPGCTSDHIKKHPQFCFIFLLLFWLKLKFLN